MTLDMTALGLTPVPDQDNVDRAVILFNARNTTLKGFSNSEDTVSGKAAREEILGDEELSALVAEFLTNLSEQVTTFLNENEGASVHIRGAETFATLKKNVSDRANEDISSRVENMSEVPESERKSRDAQIVTLKAEAGELKTYISSLAAFATQFNITLEIPEMDKISGPRLSTTERKPRTAGRKPRLEVDGTLLPEGTSFYSAVKQIRGDAELSAEAVQDAFKATGKKFGKDECRFDFNGRSLVVYPLS